MEALLRQEDTDNDKLITIDDKGPKVPSPLTCSRPLADRDGVVILVRECWL